VPFKEEDRMGGHDPYSSSKGCAEIIVSAYQRSFFSLDTYSTHGMAMATARAGNVIGGGDWSVDRLIPDAFRAFEAEKTLLIRNPSAIRPWQHVLDPLAGYMLLAKNLFETGVTYTGAWNFGPYLENDMRVADVISLLASTWGPTARWRYDETTHAHEAHTLKLDCSKAHTQLNWHPKFSLDMALQKTFDWYLAAKAKENMNEFSNFQIAEYTSTR
jgi:CDP-glucose 4,6-dehydratase